MGLKKATRLRVNPSDWACMWYLFLDESGDLGFDFQKKQPSQYLTIGVLAMSDPTAVRSVRSAVAKTLKRKVNKPRAKRQKAELKGTYTDIKTKQYFYELVKGLRFGIYSLTIEKSRIPPDQTDSPQSKSHLYNYIAQRVLKRIDFGSDPGGVELIVDKSKSKLEIADFNSYLLSQLEGLLDPAVHVAIRHRDSCEDRCLSAADLFTWGIGRFYERGDAEWLTLYREKIVSQERYP